MNHPHSRGDRWLLILLKIVADILFIFFRALTLTIVEIVYIFLGLLQRFVTDVWMTILLIIIALTKGVFRAIFGVVLRVYGAASPPVYDEISALVHRRPRLAMTVSLFALILVIIALCIFYIIYCT